MAQYVLDSQGVLVPLEDLAAADTVSSAELWQEQYELPLDSKEPEVPPEAPPGAPAADPGAPTADPGTPDKGGKGKKAS